MDALVCCVLHGHEHNGPDSMLHQADGINCIACHVYSLELCVAIEFDCGIAREANVALTHHMNTLPVWATWEGNCMISRSQAVCL